MTISPVSPLCLRVYKDLSPSLSRLTAQATFTNPSDPGGAITLELTPVTGLTVPATAVEGTPFTISLDPKLYVPAKRMTWSRGVRKHTISASPNVGSPLSLELHVLLYPGGPPGH